MDAAAVQVASVLGYPRELLLLGVATSVLVGMLVYARLREAGEGTTAARRRLLEARRAHVAAEIAALGETLAVLDDKIETYRTIEARLALSSADEGHKP